MSDTPRTDHLDNCIVAGNVDGYLAMRDFARQLEKELAAAQEASLRAHLRAIEWEDNSIKWRARAARAEKWEAA